MNRNEVEIAIENKVKLIWNDPDPIEGNDYTIQVIHFIGEDMALIHYGSSEDEDLSEAEVFLSEIEVMWICTDPDMNQYGRLIGDRVYEFKQDMKYPDGSVVHEEMEIDLNDYSDEDIMSDLDSFGYTIDDLTKEGGLEYAEWMMAECIFECSSY